LVLGDDGAPGEAVVAEFAALVAGDDGGDPALFIPLEGTPLGVGGGLALGVVAGGAGGGGLVEAVVGKGGGDPIDGDAGEVSSRVDLVACVRGLVEVRKGGYGSVSSKTVESYVKYL